MGKEEEKERKEGGEIAAFIAIPQVAYLWAKAVQNAGGGAGQQDRYARLNYKRERLGLRLQLSVLDRERTPSNPFVTLLYLDRMHTARLLLHETV